MRDIRENEIYIEEYIKVNGIEQFLYHSGTSYDNPVMLFLHGGPGVTESHHAYKVQDNWEKLYTIVHYDQRGSGKTLVKNPSDYPTMDILLKDVYEIVIYLKKKYKKEKIIIAGYSFGSIIGSLFTKEYPNDVLCYIGIGQVINMMENERLLYKKLKFDFERHGQRRHLKTLKNIGEYPERMYTKAMKHKYEIVENLQRKSSLAGGKGLFMILSFLKSPLFRIWDLKSFILSRKSNEKLVEFLMSFDIYDYSKDYKVPIFYILGENDWQVPTMLGKKYFKEINTSIKELFIIEKAKHRPMIENKKSFDNALYNIKNTINEINIKQKNLNLYNRSILEVK